MQRWSRQVKVTFLRRLLGEGPYGPDLPSQIRNTVKCRVIESVRFSQLPEAIPILKACSQVKALISAC
jgi:hypothetical protein